MINGKLKIVGNIFEDSDGNIINKPSFSYDKRTKTFNCGDASIIKRDHDRKVQGYSDDGKYDLIDELHYLEFNGEKETLTLEEIRVLFNYAVVGYQDGGRLQYLLGLSEKDLKSELARLEGYGY